MTRKRNRSWRESASEKEVAAREPLRTAAKATPTPTPPCLVLSRGKWRLDSKVPALLEPAILDYVKKLNKVEHGKVRKGGRLAGTRSLVIAEKHSKLAAGIERFGVDLSLDRDFDESRRKAMARAARQGDRSLTKDNARRRVDTLIRYLRRNDKA